VGRELKLVWERCEGLGETGLKQLTATAQPLRYLLKQTLVRNYFLTTFAYPGRQAWLFGRTLKPGRRPSQGASLFPDLGLGTN
jgi:hypothetical protein